MDQVKGELSYVLFTGAAESIRDLLVTRDYLIVLATLDPGVRQVDRERNAHLRVFDRESGMLQQTVALQLPDTSQVTISPARPGIVVQSGHSEKLSVLQPERKTP